MKKIITSFIAILLILGTFNIVKAADSISLSGPSTAKVGDTVTITIKSNGLTGNVILSAKNATLSVSEIWVEKDSNTFTATITGTPVTISASGELSNSNYDDAKYNANPITITATEPTPSTPDSGSDSNAGSSSGSNTGSNNNTGSSGSSGGSSSTETRYPTETKPQTTKTEQPKSSNNYLSGLSVGTGTLTPEFYRETYEYTVEFDDTVNLYDLKEIEVSATTEDDRATVEGAGTIQLNDGENNITLTVKAENGSERTYTVKVVKPMPVEQSDLRLKTLVLNGINTNGEYQTINIEFNPETFEYNVTVPNDITALSINPTTENEDILIETTGGDNLNEGNNRIIIMLTSPSDENVKTTYTINVERQAALVEKEQGLTKEQIGIIIIASVVGVILLIVIIVAIVKHHKKKKGFDYDEEDDDEMPFINNEEGEDVEDPYPSKILTNEDDNEDTNNNVLDDKDNNKDTDEDLKLKTTYDEENTVSDDIKDKSSRWDDFVKGYDEEDEPKAKKKKHGKRFL